MSLYYHLLDHYQREAAKFARYPMQYRIAYPALGICDGVGEFAKAITWDAPDCSEEKLLKEAGDVLWYCAKAAGDCGLPLSYCVQAADSLHWLSLFDATFKLVGCLKKHLRGDREDLHPDIPRLIGWVVLAVGHGLDEKLGFATGAWIHKAAALNLDKLTDRAERGMLKGDGDNR